MTIQRITIVGTGLIGASAGLALHAAQFPGEIIGWDRSASQSGIALDRGAIDVIALDPINAAANSDLVLLSGPVFAIQDWMEKLAPLLKPHQLPSGRSHFTAVPISPAFSPATPWRVKK